jgi:polysaccharide export outer membrane protein
MNGVTCLRSVFKGVLALSVLVILGGCDLLPSDGPNANGVLAQASRRVKADPAAVMRFALVDIDPRISADVQRYYEPISPAVPSPFQKAGSFGYVGVGDTLRVTIWEAGDAGIFGGKDKKGADFTVQVDVDGTIALPYTGRFRVAGKRLAEIEAAIVTNLTGQVIQPQATVTIANNVSSTISVQGEVLKPGPYPVVRTNQRVLDAIAMAGGTKIQPYETGVRLTRGRATMSVSLQDVIDLPETYNVTVAAGDALLLSLNQRKFLALGAVLQPGQKNFTKSKLTLADGLGQVIGLDSTRSDPMGIYLFRREPIELTRRYGVEPLAEDHDTVPIVYQLNLKDPKSFFLMNGFPIRPNDIVFVSTAPLAEAAHFFQILSGATGTVAIPRTLLGNFPSAQ